MELFKITTPSFDEGYQQCMENNGIIKSISRYINVNEISSIDRYIGQYCHKGWDCSKIKMKNGDKFIDRRSPDELLEDINQLTTKN